MKRRFRYLLPALFLMTGAVAPAAMPIPHEVQDTLAFIFVADPQRGVVPNGTGFFVGVTSDRDPSRTFLYLVTAGHVLRCDEQGPPYDRVWIRLNAKDGSTRLLELPVVVGGPHQTVFFHPDPAVDLAVIPCAPDQRAFDFKYLPEEMIVSDREVSQGAFGVGAEVFFAGLFLHFVPEARNIPIVRFGRVALAPPQPIPWPSEPRELLLIEGWSYGGNSGSPLFFYLGAEREPGVLAVGPPLLRLAGIMSGAYNDIREVQFIGPTALPISTSNLGIAAAVPAYKLLELLHHYSPLTGRRQ